MAEHFQVPRLGHRAFKADALHLQEAVEAHHTHAHAAFAHGGIFGAGHLAGRAVDVILQHIIEEAQHILDEQLVGVPLVPCFQVQRGQAAHRRPIIAQVIFAGGQGDFAAQVRRGHLQPQIAVMLRHHAVHGVVEDDVWLAGGEARFDQLLEQAARVHRAAHLAGLGAAQVEFLAVAYGLHELVGQQHAVVQVQSLAVEIATGFADL